MIAVHSSVRDETFEVPTRDGPETRLAESPAHFPENVEAACWHWLEKAPTRCWHGRTLVMCACVEPTQQQAPLTGENGQFCTVSYSPQA